MSIIPETTLADLVTSGRVAHDSPADIHPLLRGRRSRRSFDERPVDGAALGRLFEAARWASSAANEQPWRFVIVRRTDAEAHARLIAALTGRNAWWAPQAPVLVLGLARVLTERGRTNPHALYDLGQAVGHLTVQAEAEGLAVRQMGGFDRTAARQALGVPEGYEPVVLFAIGHPGRPEELPEELRAGETAARTRRSLGEIAFEGRFGVPFTPGRSAP